MVPRARIELARAGEGPQDFKSCASTNFATGARAPIIKKFEGPCHPKSIEPFILANICSNFNQNKRISGNGA